MDGPHAKQTGDDIQPSNDGKAYQKGLRILQESVHADPDAQQGRVEKNEGPYVALKDERQRLVQGDILHILAQSHRGPTVDVGMWFL